MISYKELRAKTMPPEKEKSASRDFIAHYLLRPISDIMSIPLIKAKVSATSVTIFSGIFPLVALFSFVFFKGALSFWTGWFCIFIWNLLDGVDGNIARYTNSCSKRGELWDATVGWMAMIAFYVGMGMTAYYDSGYFVKEIPVFYYILMGAFSAMSCIFPRLVMHKKYGLSGAESVKEVKERSDYGFLKLLVFNITSINGGAAVLFLVAYLLNIVGLCTICYFVLNLLITVVSLEKLLK